MDEITKKESIEKFLRNELSEVEKNNFQQQLKIDEDLAKHLAAEQAIFDAIQIATEDNFRNRLSQITNTKQSVKAKTIPLFRKNWIIAASLLFLLGFFGWFLLRQPLSTPSQLFAENYEIPSFEINRNTYEITPEIQLIANAYQQEKYIQVIELLAPLIENQDSPKLTLLLGISYLEVGQLDKAINVFQQLIREAKLTDDAVWYLGLTYLKMDQVSSAKQTFEQLLTNTFPVTQKRQAKARIILKNL